jgi:pimeloyl-ACP methyl ester carboxylesterase
VFVHAWALNGDMWTYQMPDLLDAGLRCIAYDRRGHGRSDRPGGGYDYDTLADDLAALIERLDLSEITLVAHSQGGGDALRYLSRHGDDRIESVVLLAPTTPCSPGRRTTPTASTHSCSRPAPRRSSVTSRNGAPTTPRATSAPPRYRPASPIGQSGRSWTRRSRSCSTPRRHSAPPTFGLSCPRSACRRSSSTATSTPLHRSTSPGAERLPSSPVAGSSSTRAPATGSTPPTTSASTPTCSPSSAPRERPRAAAHRRRPPRKDGCARSRTHPYSRPLAGRRSG